VPIPACHAGGRGFESRRSRLTMAPQTAQFRRWFVAHHGDKTAIWKRFWKRQPRDCDSVSPHSPIRPFRGLNVRALVVTGRSARQSVRRRVGRPRDRLATDRLHGKGVDGSSPSESFAKSPLLGLFLYVFSRRGGPSGPVWSRLWSFRAEKSVRRARGPGRHGISRSGRR
jgi:hypothetical protein